MKKAKTGNNIQWYEPENNRRRPTATIKSDGVLCFGREMRERLSRKIRIGFSPGECTLHVEENQEGGFTLSKNGKVNQFGIARELLSLGIKLPVSFLFFEEAGGNSWIGYIIPTPRKSGEMTSPDERASIFIAYKCLVDKAVYNIKHTKSIPPDERRAIADMALWEAISNYTQMHGSFKEYIFQEIKGELLKQNRNYTNRYRCISADALINEDDKSDKKIYDLLPDIHKNEIAAADRRMHMDLFRNTYLDKREAKILRMLFDGYTVDEILPKHKMTAKELTECCKSIGERWELHLANSM